MINLSSLSALIRAIRTSNAADAAAPAVMRVPSIRPVAEDDAGAMLSTALRQPPWSTTSVVPEGVPADEVRGAPLREARAGAPDDARRPATHANAATPAPAAQLPSTALELTAAARVLQAALRNTGLRAPAPAAIGSAMPLADSPHEPALQLARSLEHAIATSGLFYESHLARVLRRDYSLASLSREPQAAWPSGTLSPDSPAPASSTTSEAASTMLTKQLDVLDTRALAWSGDVWPGQRATIALREDLSGEAANDASEEPAHATWRMQVALDLPSLGHVQATIALRGRNVDFVLTAANEIAQLRLDAAKPQLATSLDAADVVAARIDVERAPTRG
jgi:hypothetical protein